MAMRLKSSAIMDGGLPGGLPYWKLKLTDRQRDGTYTNSHGPPAITRLWGKSVVVSVLGDKSAGLRLSRHPI